MKNNFNEFMIEVHTQAERLKEENEYFEEGSFSYSDSLTLERQNSFIWNTKSSNT